MTSVIWFRQDLRLADQAAVRAAAAAGPVVALYVLDDETPGNWRAGGASRWWLHHSLTALASDLAAHGVPLVLRRGRAGVVVPRVAAEAQAHVYALDHFEPFAQRQQAEVARGCALTLHAGTTLVPPHAVRSGSGGRYRIFTPWWNSLQQQMPPALPLPAPALTAGPKLASDTLADWGLLPTHPDWATGFTDWQPGEAGAMVRLEGFAPRVGGYDHGRNFPSDDATARLSPHLHFGEISPAQTWHGVAAHAGARPWLRQLAWRDFAIQTLDLFPDSPWLSTREAFTLLPFTDVTTTPGAAWLRAWQTGRTGYPIVDAGMRQLWATGWMHNRVRMITASFLTKHLLIDWRHGERWFWDTLVDADQAANTLGWQWVMGSGADSSPFYRIFAPVGQSEKFDAAAYIRRWVPELAALRDTTIHAPWQHGGARGYPPPLVDHAAARARALAVYAEVKA